MLSYCDELESYELELDVYAHGVMLKVNRREFIFFKNRSNGKEVIELSCETLYMQFMDIETAGSIFEEETKSINENSWLSDEPPVQLTINSTDDFFDDLQAQLSGCKKLRLLDSSWIVVGKFKEKIEYLLYVYETSGGEIEFVNKLDKLN